MYKCRFCGAEAEEINRMRVPAEDSVEVVDYCQECGSLEPYDKGATENAKV